MWGGIINLTCLSPVFFSEEELANQGQVEHGRSWWNMDEGENQAYDSEEPAGLVVEEVV